MAKDSARRQLSVVSARDEFTDEESDEEALPALLRGYSSMGAKEGAKEREKTHKAVLKIQVDTIHKTNQYIPAANIYKCWSVNLFGGRSHLLAFLVIVIFLQIMTPCFLMAYTNRTLMRMDLVDGWTGLFETYDEIKGNFTNFNTKQHMDLNFFQWACYSTKTHVFLEEKLLGAAFMLLIFLQNDQALLQYDLEQHNFQKYFPHVSCMSRSLDTFCNLWAITMIGMAIGPVLETSDNLSGLILDSMGFLFLANLDDFATSGIFFGYDSNEFDEVVAVFREQYLDDLEDGHFEEDDDGTPWSAIVVSFFRFVNLVNVAIQLPIFMLFTLKNNPQLQEAMETSSQLQIPGYFKIFDFAETWLPFTVVILFAVYFQGFCSFALGAWRNTHPDGIHYIMGVKSRYEVADFDLRGFFAYVVMRRPDPRHQIIYSKEVAKRQRAVKAE